MHFLSSPYTVPLFLGAITSIIVAFYSWKRRGNAPIAKTLTFLMMALAVWSAGYALQLAGADMATKIFWRHVKNIGVVLTPTLWLIATLQYTGRNKAVTRGLVQLLAIEPIIGMTMDLTSNYHQFFIKEVVMKSIGNIYILDNIFGPWFWINVIYSYLLFTISTILFVNTFFRVRKLYRNQILVLLGIALFPWGENIFYVSTLLLKWQDTMLVDLTPFFFVIASLLLAWGTFSLQLLDVVPIARDVILQNMRNGVLVLDTQATIVDFSPMIEQIVGKHEDELIGYSAHRVLGRWEELCQTIKAQKTGVGEISLQRDNTLKTYEWRISELSTSNDQIIGWVVILFDMSRLKDVEFALQQSNRELRNQIAQREQLIADLDAFAHTVAHDLQNPLSIIVGYADVISMELDNEHELSDYVIRIEETALKMGRIINELMFLAQVRKKNVVLYPLDTRKIVKEVEKRLTKMINDYHAELITPNRWIPAMGYAPWIEEVWENYISNAIKYGGKPPIIEIGSTLMDDKVKFWIKDNGDGLAPDMQKKVFEDNVNLPEKIKNGHGLGLSVVRRILEKQGGAVDVTCSGVSGEGCVFSFTLPIVPALKPKPTTLN